MAKEQKRTGRPIKVGQPGKRVSLGLKVTGELKNRIDGAAKASGRTQSQEAELRLERSFTEEGSLGGPEFEPTARVILGAFMRGGQRGARARKHPEWTPARWIDDDFCFLAACKALSDALQLIRPESVSEPSLREDLKHIFASEVARGNESVEFTREDDEEELKR